MRFSIFFFMIRTRLTFFLSSFLPFQNKKGSPDEIDVEATPPPPPSVRRYLDSDVLHRLRVNFEPSGMGSSSPSKTCPPPDGDSGGEKKCFQICLFFIFLDFFFSLSTIFFNFTFILCVLTTFVFFCFLFVQILRFCRRWCVRR